MRKVGGGGSSAGRLADGSETGCFHHDGKTWETLSQRFFWLSIVYHLGLVVRPDFSSIVESDVTGAAKMPPLVSGR